MRVTSEASMFLSIQMHLRSLQLKAFFCTVAARVFDKMPPVKRNFCHTFQECSRRRALNPGKQAHAQMILSGFKPTVFVTNCLIQMYTKCSNMSFSCKVFDNMPHRDTITWNSMIFAYCGRGEMMTAQSLFDEMPEKDVISWNSLISGYMHNGDYIRSIDIFLQMGKLGVCFDHTTLAMILKSCSSLEDSSIGRQIHGIVAKIGMSSDMVTGSALVDMYAKCKNLNDSLKFFHEIPCKNEICWSAMIAGCVQNGLFINSLKLFKEMQRQGVGVSQSIYASVLRACAGLSSIRIGCQLHGHAIKMNFGLDAVVATATLDMYSKCKSLTIAQRLFDLMPNRRSHSYNAIMVGCLQNGDGHQVLELFQHLRRSRHDFDDISLSAALSACASIKELSFGCQLHCLLVKHGLLTYVCVANAVLDMYGKCGALADARAVFDQMSRRDAISWTSIIACSEQNGKEEETLSLFVSMLCFGFEPDEFTYGSVLKASASNYVSRSGIEIHSRIIKSGMGLHSFVGSALVDMYCKYSMMSDALKLHNRIDHKNMVSWNAIISGYSSQENDEEAQSLFSYMLQRGFKPDNFTYATVLDTCANLATVELGKQIHAQIIKHELQVDAFITSALVDMYSKCGNVQDSKLMFEKARNRDFVTWNAMLCGYAYNGYAEEALDTFKRMQQENVKPNHSTFLSILRACGHMGLAERGLYYFNLMNNYGLDPKLDHYACMVDILGRSGRISEALKLIDDMPFEADDVIWRTLLCVCKIHRNVRVAEKAANCIMQLDPGDSSVYALLNSIYAEAGMWDKVSMMRKEMRQNKIKKEPGCSWIEVMGEVHTFLANTKAHPKCEEIYRMLHVVYDGIDLVEFFHEQEFDLVHQEELLEQQKILAVAS